jgi:hypothetical protein
MLAYDSEDVQMIRYFCSGRSEAVLALMESGQQWYSEEWHFILQEGFFSIPEDFEDFVSRFVI